MSDILIVAEMQKAKLRAEIAKIDRFLSYAESMAGDETAEAVEMAAKPLMTSTIFSAPLLFDSILVGPSTVERVTEAVREESPDEPQAAPMFLAMRLRDPADQTELAEAAFETAVETGEASAISEVLDFNAVPETETAPARRTLFRSDYVNRAIREAAYA